MNSRAIVTIWAAQVRAPFLVLSVLLTGIGGAKAFYDGAFDMVRFILCLTGTVLAHVSVNLFNEYSDHKTRIDFHTKKTPFSGGSGSLQKGDTTPRQVLTAALGALAGALAIGLYLVATTGPLLWLFMVVGAGCVLLYTSFFSRWGMGEPAAGISLGSMVVLGTYYVLAGTVPATVVFLSIPPGILTALLLLLNEFPDAEADKKGGRGHLVIRFGWRNAAVMYTVALAAAYALIMIGVLVKIFPLPLLLACITLPAAITASSIALRFGNRFDKMTAALGANVTVVLGTDFLIALGYLL